MTPAAIGRRLGELEARLATLRPVPPRGGPLAWLEWLSCEELDLLEHVAQAAALEGRELSDAEALRFRAVEAAALQRMAEGWPRWVEDQERYAGPRGPAWGPVGQV